MVTRRNTVIPPHPVFARREVPQPKHRIGRAGGRSGHDRLTVRSPRAPTAVGGAAPPVKIKETEMAGKDECIRFEVDPAIFDGVCTVAALRSNCSTVSETSSETRRAWRKARRTSNSSRTGLRFLRAALRSCSISASVRYSRDRKAALGLRPPRTVGKTDCDGLSCTTVPIDIFPSIYRATIVIVTILTIDRLSFQNPKGTPQNATAATTPRMRCQ
jgi:hypothetical protein